MCVSSTHTSSWRYQSQQDELHSLCLEGYSLTLHPCELFADCTHGDDKPGLEQHQERSWGELPNQVFSSWTMILKSTETHKLWTVTDCSQFFCQSMGNWKYPNQNNSEIMQTFFIGKVPVGACWQMNRWMLTQVNESSHSKYYACCIKKVLYHTVRSTSPTPKCIMCRRF